MIIDNPIISGSAIVSGSLTITGSISVSDGITGSITNAELLDNRDSLSFATTGSNNFNGGSNDYWVIINFWKYNSSEIKCTASYIICCLFFW